MKRLLILLPALTVLASSAQPPSQEDTTKAEATKAAEESVTTMRLEKPNEITVGRVTVSGIVCQAIKTDNPLQLINPLAPPEYGPGEQNVVREPGDRRVSGLKLLSFSF